MRAITNFDELSTTMTRAKLLPHRLSYNTSHTAAIYRSNYSDFDPYNHTHSVVREEVHYSSPAVEVVEDH